eukprot:gene1531-biopygen1393
MHGVFAIVRGYAESSDGASAWRRLFEVCRHTSYVYLVTQVRELAAQATKLGVLDNPVLAFIGAKECLRRVREYAFSARVGPVEDYQKHGKLPGAALACEDVVVTPGVVGGPESAFAMQEALVPYVGGASECEDVLFSTPGSTRRAGGRVRSTAPPGCTTFNRYSPLCSVEEDGALAAEDSAAVAQPVSVLWYFYRWRRAASARRRGAGCRARRMKRHQYTRNKHPIKSGVPVYDSFVYVDALGAFHPGSGFGQRQWEAARVQHLGHAYAVSLRQFWYSAGEQSVHTTIMIATLDMLDAAQRCYDYSLYYYRSGDENVDALDVELAGLRELFRREPAEVRGTMESFKRWAARIGLATRRIVALSMALSGEANSDTFASSTDSDGLGDSDTDSEIGTDDGSLPALASVTDSDIDSDMGTDDAYGAVDGSGVLGLKTALLDSGATRHVFSDVGYYGLDFDDSGTSVFWVVQGQTVQSVGSGTVTMVKRDLSSGNVIGLDLTECHCIPNQPFNLVSVVALEDAGFTVEFGRRRISRGGVTFAFRRGGGRQYIVEEDSIGEVVVHLACSAEEEKHEAQCRDHCDWRFEDLHQFSEQLDLELFASHDNKHLSVYCTAEASAFDKDWTGHACSGNPPFEHDFILRCLQKAVRDYGSAPSSTKFLLVLPKWVTPSWWCLTDRFSVVKEYPAGVQLFSPPAQGCYIVEQLQLCGADRVWICPTKWPVMTLYKDAHTVEKVDPKIIQHIRLGHPSDACVKHMLDQGVPLGITERQYVDSLVDHCPDRCMPCRLTKATRPTARATRRQPAEECVMLTWSDTCGPFVPSAGGYRWYVLFLDDHTNWGAVYFLRKKSDYLDTLQEYVPLARKHRSIMGMTGDCHMVLHTDEDSTMISGRTAEYCKQQGIEQRHGSPNRHENQAQVERLHRDVEAMARVLLMTAGFDLRFWPMGVRHGIYLLNRHSRRAREWSSAFWSIYQCHPDLSGLRVVGCLAYAYSDPDVREDKFSDRARAMRYVGHSEVSSAYLPFDPVAEKVVKAGMVVFCERLDEVGKVVLTWDRSVVAPLKSNFMLPLLDSEYRERPEISNKAVVVQHDAYIPDGSDEIIAVVKLQTAADCFWTSVRWFLEGAPENQAQLASYEGLAMGVNACYPLFTEFRVDTGLGNLEAAVVCARALHAHQFPVLCGLADQLHGDRLTGRQALKAPDAVARDEAIQQELQSLVRVKGALEMLEPKDLPAGVRPLEMSLIQKVKLTKLMELDKRKARICVRGNKQVFGVEHIDTFAPST